jgi:alpha-galactosidase
LPAHGSLVLRLTNTVAEAPRQITYYPAASSSSILAGGARNNTVNATLTTVGFIGSGGTLTVTGVDGGATGGTKLLSLDYINADFTAYNNACSNCRNAYVSINGNQPVLANMPISGQVSSFHAMKDVLLILWYEQSWDILFEGYLISLPGFKPGKDNTITFSNPSAFAPDIYRVGVVH